AASGPLPAVRRFQPAAPPHASPRDLEEAARRLVEARAPLIVTEALGRRPEATPVLCRLAERLAAPMIDLAAESEGRASVPSRHPLDMTGARQEVVAEADVVLALDVTNLLGALGAVDRATRAVRLFNEHARVIVIPLASSVFAAEIWDVIRDEDWVLANGTAKGWARRLRDWRPERTYGGSGGAGLGYGLPAALGVTLAHRGSSKVCVNLQSDGDL